MDEAERNPDTFRWYASEPTDVSAESHRFTIEFVEALMDKDAPKPPVSSVPEPCQNASRRPSGQPPPSFMSHNGSMDQGLAAVLGSAVGVLGTSMAASLAFWQGRWVTRQQLSGANSQWRRQVQREAYGAFMTQYMKASRFLVETATATKSRQYTEADLDGLTSAIREHRGELMSAMVAVKLEGPPELGDLAQEALGAITEWWASIYQLARALAEDANSDDQERALRGAEQEAGRQMGRFTASAQDHLDHVP
ncbi:hypothetical protein ACFUKV_14675 [Streptomyces paradoxus]|uniref:hypothetical protein n=1 Tax=Streptomyces paradoxus TaxID=66375 RepID=UPI0036343148